MSVWRVGGAGEGWLHLAKERGDVLLCKEMEFEDVLSRLWVAASGGVLSLSSSSS